jgi:hypothetical protein
MTVRELVPAQSSGIQAGSVVFVLLTAVYLLTGAREVTFWDAGEFATAIATFGIPHPPGTPLYVALGTTVWHLLPGVSPIVAGATLSAVCTAAACALLTGMTARITNLRVLALTVGFSAGVMGTVWLNATETEVYAVSLLAIALQLAVAYRAHTRDDDRARVLLAYVIALSLPLHLSALVGAPAALLLATTAPDGRVRWRTTFASATLVFATVAASRAALGMVALGLLAACLLAIGHRWSGARWMIGATVVTLLAWSALAILPFRAAHDPFLNQGNPDTWKRLLDVVARTQYDVAPLWPRRAPVWLQLGNVMQYADWQVALSLWNDVTPSLLRTPFTVLLAVLGAIGARAHWIHERVTARCAVALMLLATFGVATQLNLRVGPSFGHGVVSAATLHEARERDYFFALAFWCWGCWIGVGAYAVATQLRRARRAAVLVPLLMLLSNWAAVTRSAAQPEASIPGAIAAELLRAAPPSSLLLTAGDNDSYPLWYRQVADSLRRDVQIVVTPLLGANWYLTESSRRARLPSVDTLAARDASTRAARLAGMQLDRGGTVAVSVMIDAAARTTIGRLAGVQCWQRTGLVDVGFRTSPCPARVDVLAESQAAANLARIAGIVPRQSPDGMAALFVRIAGCPGGFSSPVRDAALSPDSARFLLDITCNLR